MFHQTQMDAETIDESEDEDSGDGHYRTKALTKKEKKRQERDEQRQVKELLVSFFFICRFLHLNSISPL